MHQGYPYLKIVLCNLDIEILFRSHFSASKTHSDFNFISSINKLSHTSHLNFIIISIYIWTKLYFFYIAAIQRVEKSGQYAYRDRKAKKRSFRGLWIQRINAAARELGMTYGVLINKLNVSGFNINRKMLADLAVREPDSFKSISMYESYWKWK